MGYGHVKGEECLRVQIAKYIRESRGVAAHPEQIIVGAGVQSLLSILCRLLKRDHQCIAFEDPGFRNGQRIFSDHAFDIVPVSMGTEGIRVQAR